MRASWRTGWRRSLRLVLAALALTGALSAQVLGGEKSILVFGDSLMAGYGLAASEAFVAQLQAILDAEQIDARLVNASVSGDTTGSGLQRLDWTMAEEPDAMILGLGANDMLEGLPVGETKGNLAAILERLRDRHIPVLLAGMKANRGLGADYVAQFDAIYPDLAKDYDAVFYPFLLEGVAMDAALNQDDFRHPNAAGVRKIVSAMLPYVRQLLSRTE